MYHVVGYYSMVGGVTSAEATPLQDPILAIANGHYLPHVQLFFYGGWFGGTSLNRVVMDTPRARQVVPPTLWPINPTLSPQNRPNMVDRRQNPFILSAVEEVRMLYTVGGTGTVQSIGVMFWGTSIDPIPMGDIYSVHGTSTTSTTANQWTQLKIDWEQNLPAGTYVVVGSQHQTAGAVAHRMIFRDQVWRPGFLSVESLSDMTDHGYYYGSWGRLGSFTTYTFPQIEVWTNIVSAAHDVTLNIIRTM